VRRPLALAVALLAGWPASGAAEPPAILERMERAWARVSDYVARFERQEVLGGALRPPEEALLKYQRPDRIYMRWIAGPGVGREILFVRGRDDDRILLREPGFFTRLFTVVLAPDSPRVLRQSRQPVTDVGIGRLIELVGREARRAAAADDLTVVDRGVRDGRSSVEFVFSGGRDKGYACQRLLLGVDATSGLPVRATLHDGHGALLARYAYRDVRLNPGLTAADFDPANPRYGFPSWRVTP